jgi:two-component sensor histidine kinase
MRQHVIWILLFSLLAVGTVHASRQSDSLHTQVDGTATDRERAGALLTIARSQLKSQPDESLRKITVALSLAEQAGDKTLLLAGVRLKRDLELSAGAYDQFLLSALRALQLSEQQDDKLGLASDIHFLCEAYERVGDLDRAIEMRRQALFLLKSTGDSVAIGKGIVDLMNSLVMAGRYTEMLGQSQEALAYYKTRNDTLGQAMVLRSQGQALLAQKRYADAIPALSHAERIFREKRFDEHLALTLRDLAEANVGMARWSDARIRLDEALFMAQESGRSNGDPKLLHLASLILEGEGRLAEALVMERHYVTVKDSLFSARIAERMLGLQALYTSERKVSENTELRMLTDSQQDLISRARVRGRLWVAFVTVLVAAIIALLLAVKRNRKLANRWILKSKVVARQAEEIKAKNIELERRNLRLADALVSEEQKDTQLKEIHHRVKNNLQIVNTLLKMQGMYVDSDVLQEVLNDCQGRVRSMALVHEHIYRCGDLNQVNVKAHLLALGDAIIRHHGLQGKVSLDLKVNYDHADLDNLIPLSLLLNELISNSTKHAFHDRSDGVITIVLRRLGDSQCELVFSDNGSGLRQEQFFHNDSFGLELVRTLAGQLDGRIRLLKGEGTTFQMTFEPQMRVLRKAS